MGSCESTAKNSEEKKSGENIEQLNMSRLSSEEEVIKKIAIGAGIVLLGWGLCKLINNGGSNNKKMMKAPGRNDSYIYRDEFESNPSEYFRRLRD
ncbi:hypothetical protein RDI58_007651 [Solanum bulbocastanum]|uniref:Uncharacterized protein n=1 Tax=Solanum bulbocastanum TaxID=147425 RepID=A0AAN8U0P5_SOLBU